MIVKTPAPPYFAVVFTSVGNELDREYVELTKRMENLAKEQKGFLGLESARNEIGITVSYWKSLEDIVKWKENLEHKEAQRLGKEKFYSKYKLRIAQVERDYEWEKL